MLTKTSKSNKKQLFSEVYQAYYSPFCLYAHRFINDFSTCKDIVSEVFVNIWDKVDEKDLASDSIVAYLKVSVRNRCYNHIKRQSTQCNCSLEKEKSPIYADHPDDIYTLNELYQRLYDILEQLPKQEMLVFTKSVFEGKTHNEIANELNISVRSVNRYKQKTIHLLQQRMKEFMPLLTFYFILKH